MRRLPERVAPAPEPAPVLRVVEAAPGTLYHVGTLRGGQALHHVGNIVVVGDVNPGAELVATGDIVVFGRLAGVAHAGAQGEQTARVFALDLDATQLRIATFIAADSGDEAHAAPRSGAGSRRPHRRRSVRSTRRIGSNWFMSGRRIVVTSGKGGVGKTTTTANLGATLAKRGKRVILVDADIGLRNLDLVLGLEKRIVFDLVEVAEGRCQLRQALIKDKRFESLSILPAAQTREKDAISEEQFASIVEQAAEQADFVLIDCPAGIEAGFRNAVAGATEAIVVTTPEVSAIRDADRVVGKLNDRGKPMRLIVNRLRPDMVKSGDMLSVDDVCEILSIELLGVVPDDEEIIDTTNRGEPIVLDETNRLRGIYDKIARRLEGEIVPFTSFENQGFFGRLIDALKAG